MSISSIWNRGRRLLAPRPKRRFHAYGVGCGKSGTHSMAAIFEAAYRAEHEPEAQELMNCLFETWEGRLPQHYLRSYVRRRDERLMLEFDSSGLNVWILGHLVQEFPGAKFILPIRDAYSWVDSIINQILGKRPVGNWQRLRDHCYLRKGAVHPPEEKVLAEHGLYTLDSFLSFWTWHNETVLATVPRERLLVIRTHEIQQSLPAIAGFLAIPVETLNAAGAHAYQASKKFGVAERLDPGYLDARVRHHCRRLMEQYFPGYSAETLHRRRAAG